MNKSSPKTTLRLQIIYYGLWLSKLLYTEVYSELSQASKMELFAKILDGFQLLLSLLPKFFYGVAYSQPG